MQERHITPLLKNLCLYAGVQPKALRTVIPASVMKQISEI